MGIDLNNEQIYAIYDLENWWHKSSNQIYEISGAAGTGKCEPDFITIPTPEGNKTIGSLRKGDYVFNKNGNAVKILGVYPQGIKQEYKITLDDGRTNICGEEHLWTVYDDKNVQSTKNTKELYESYLYNSSLYKIDNNKAVHLPEKSFIYKPYDIGKMILNGDLSNIPEEYMYGSINQRIELISGLFDINGKIDDNGDIYYESTNGLLTDNIRKIIYSIGLTCTFDYININLEEDSVIFKLKIISPNKYKYIFFYNKEKRNIIEKFIDDDSNDDIYNYRTIVSVEKLNLYTSMTCIYIDDPDHLYLTKDYVVTHNTTLIKYFIDRLNLSYENVLFVAFMGKAASQMARNGLPAKTIHSAIYEYQEVMARDDEGNIILSPKGKPKMVPKFILKDHISKKIKLIVVDEGSMVDEKMALDLLSFNIPTIVLGDLNQLPPVIGKPFFLKNPDTILHKVMRQAENNPIIWLSQQVLSGNPLVYGVYGNSSVISKRDITEFHFRQSDIILTGTNRLRYNINNYCREDIKQIKKLEYPHIGEKVICRKNNWNQCLNDNIYMTNGTTGFVDNIYKESYNGKTMIMDFRPDFIKKSFKNIEFDYKHMYSIPGVPEDNNKYGQFYDKMEFAYAITVHSCLTLDTLVYTDKGMIPLGELQLNYKDYKIYNGLDWETPASYINNGYDDVNEIILSNGIRYNVTDNHKCKVLEHRKDSNNNDYYVLVNKYGKDIMPDDKLIFNKNQNIYVDNEFIFKNDIYGLKNFKLSTNIAILSGLIFSNGEVHKSSISFANKNKKIINIFIRYFQLLIKELEDIATNYSNMDIKQFSSLIYLLDDTSHVIYKDDNNIYHVNIYNKIIVKLFNDNNIYNKRNKHIPRFIMMSNKNYHAAFISGLFTGFNLANKEKIIGDEFLSFDFNGYNAAKETLLILLNMGISSNIININKEDGHNYYRLSIFNNNYDIYAKNIGFIDNIYKKYIYIKHIQKSNNAIIIDEASNQKLSSIDNYEVVSVECIFKKYENTACLEMPYTHRFVQDGIIGGNSQGSQWPNVMYMHEDFMRSKEDNRRLMYTAITRASNSLIFVK